MAVVNEVMAQAQAAGQYEGFRAHTSESREAGAVASLPPIARDTVRAEPVEADQESLSWRDSLTVPRELPEEKLVALECRQAAAWIAQQIASGRCAAAHHGAGAQARPARRDGGGTARPAHPGAAAREDRPVRGAGSPGHRGAARRAGVAYARPVAGAGAEVPAVRPGRRRAGRAGCRGAAGAGRRPARAVVRAAASRSTISRPACTKPLSSCAIGKPCWSAGRRTTRWMRSTSRAMFWLASALALRRPCAKRCWPACARLLGAALQVDGARYATPYGFVRALKAGGIQAPALSETQAVRLLTVHGAKGLEAPIVLMLDTDGTTARAETMGVIVEWPGEAPAPWRFAFIASETRPPACSAEALEVEKTARQREELNALYVAMTRARNRLVLSSVEPYAVGENSWWQRLQALCTPIEAPRAAPAPADSPEAAGQRFLLPQLPTLSAAKPADARQGGARARPDSNESRFGQALHRLLEGWAGGVRSFAQNQVRRVAREFALTDALAGEAAAMAQRILSGEGAWAWDLAARGLARQRSTAASRRRAAAAGPPGAPRRHGRVVGARLQGGSAARTAGRTDRPAAPLSCGGAGRMPGCAGTGRVPDRARQAGGGAMTVAVVGAGPAGLMAARSAVPSRPAGGGLRRHAVGGPQVPAGGQGRPQPHAFGAVRALRLALWRSPPADRALAQAVRCAGVAGMGAGTGHRHLRGHVRAACFPPT